MENRRIATYLTGYSTSHSATSGRDTRVNFEAIPYAAQVYPAPSNPVETQALLVPSRPVTPQMSNSTSFDRFLDAYNRYRHKSAPTMLAASSDYVATAMMPQSNREPSQFEDFAAYIPEPYVPVWRWGLSFNEILRRNGYIRPFHPMLLRGLMKPLLRRCWISGDVGYIAGRSS